MELKEPLSFEKQIKKLKSHGMVMEDEARVKEILAEINKITMFLRWMDC